MLIRTALGKAEWLGAQACSMSTLLVRAVFSLLLQCFRLYTRSYFERQMPDVTPPEICRTSLAGAVLGLKALGLPGLDVLSFDFLDPPEQVRMYTYAASTWSLGAVLNNTLRPVLPHLYGCSHFVDDQLVHMRRTRLSCLCFRQVRHVDGVIDTAGTTIRGASCLGLP